MFEISTSGKSFHNGKLKTNKPPKTPPHDDIFTDFCILQNIQQLKEGKIWLTLSSYGMMDIVNIQLATICQRKINSNSKTEDIS